MTNTLWTLARQRRSWAAGLLAALVTSAAVAAPVYHVVDLGGDIAREGGTNRPRAMNAQGDVVGYVERRNDQGVLETRPVLFRDSKPKPLDLMSKSGVDFAAGGDAAAIDKFGRIAVIPAWHSAFRYRAFIYSKGKMEMVEVPKFIMSGAITGMSDLGHLLVRGIDVRNGSDGLAVRQPDGTWVKLERWEQKNRTVGLAINIQGAVVGYGQGKTHNGYRQALLWLNGTPQPVPGTTGLMSTATAINDRGDIAGYLHRSVDSDYDRAFVVRDGQLTRLSTGYVETVALGLDNTGRVVGYGADKMGSANGGFLAQDGQILWLDDLVEPAQQGQWKITSAVAINDAGEIAAEGYSIRKNKWSTLKLVPVTAH